MLAAALVLVLSAAAPSAVGDTVVAPTEAWRPMYSFLGSWKGTGTGPAGPVQLTRSYASASTNHHIEITEAVRGHSPATIWGTVSYDPRLPGLVLRRYSPGEAADGAAQDLALDAAASTADRLVFASAPTGAVRTRVTYEHAGWNVFVERVERADSSGAFTVLTETRFTRKD